ncbi:MAG: hypothetical protein H6732_07810 [Alphaproteobacteria bacterium]|nr:hypothetical protein [Alphaproteobacteria bacterium]
MPSVALSPPLDAPAVTDVEAVRTVGLAGGGVLGLSLATTLVIGAPLLFAPLVGAALTTAAQVVVLTVPSLLVVQVAAGLDITPRQTLGALRQGVHDGGALLVALVPLALFFGSSGPSVWTTLAGFQVAGTTALFVALVRSGFALVDAEPEAGPRARLVAAAWVATGLLVALGAASNAFRLALRVLV